MPKILAFAGATRRESFNKKLLRVVVDKVRGAGGDVTHVDLRDYPLPIYDGDLEAEQGIPANAATLYEMMKAHPGLLLACPEYNSSITGVLKNTLDWISRPRPNEPYLVAFTGKVAGLCSASPGALGGLRGLVHVRSILGNVGMHVIPTQVALPMADKAFADDGKLKDAKFDKMLGDLAVELVMTTGKLLG